MARYRFMIKFVFQSVTTAYVVGWSILLASQVNIRESVDGTSCDLSWKLSSMWMYDRNIMIKGSVLPQVRVQQCKQVPIIDQVRIQQLTP